MKSKKLFGIILSIILLLLLGCNYESNKISSESKYTTIKLSVADGGSAREINALDYSVYESLVYVLTGEEVLSTKEIEDGAEAELIFEKYDDLDAINAATVSIKIATWTLSVKAYNPDLWNEEDYENGSIKPVLCFKQTIAVSDKIGIIKVEMEFDENTDERGSFEYQVYYPADDHFSVEASIFGDYGEDQLVIKQVEKSEVSGFYRADLEVEDLNFGEYYLKLILTYKDGDENEKTYKTEPVIFISPMVITTGSYTFSDVNRLYTISYGKSEGINYSTDDLPTVYKQYESTTIPAVESEEPYYSFDGWYYSTKDGRKELKLTEKEDYSFNDEHNLNGAITLYPIFTSKTYTIVFHANGGEGEMESQTFKIENDAIVNKNTFTAPAGKRFAGWAEASDGDVVCPGESFVNKFNIGKETTINAYAVWEDLPKLTLTITSGDNTWNGGKDDVVDFEALDGEELTISALLSDATIWYSTDGVDPHDSKSVKQYNAKEDGPFIISGGNDYCFQAYAERDEMLESDVVTINIIFKEFNITFNPGDAEEIELEPVTNKVKSGKTIEVPEFTWKYHTQTGWTYGTDNSETYTFTNNKFEVSDSDMTFTAQWKENGKTPDVVFSGITEGSTKGSVDYGGQITLSCSGDGSENAVIYYKLEGSETEKYEEYTSPIVITEETIISAYAENESKDLYPSEVVTVTYTIKETQADVGSQYVTFVDLNPNSSSELLLKIKIYEDKSYQITAQSAKKENSVTYAKTYNSFKWFIDGELVMADGVPFTGLQLEGNGNELGYGSYVIYCIAEASNGDVDEVSYRLTIKY